MPKKTLSVPAPFARNSKELPATQVMLQLVRSELKADIRGLRSETKFGFGKLDSKFHLVDSKFDQVLSEVARIGFMVEEQNSKNHVVLEGLTGIYQRQDRSDLRMEEVQNIIQGLAARSRTKAQTVCFCTPSLEVRA